MKRPEGPVNGRSYPGARNHIGGSWVPEPRRPRVTGNGGKPPKPPKPPAGLSAFGFFFGVFVVLVIAYFALRGR